MAEFKVSFYYTPEPEWDYRVIEADDAAAAEELFWENGPWYDNIEIDKVEDY